MHMLYRRILSTYLNRIQFSRKGTISNKGSSDHPPSNPLAGGPQGIGSKIEELIFDDNGQLISKKEYMQG